MYTTARRYEGVTNTQEATKRVQEGFVPLISGMPGFIEYQWVDLGQGAMLSVSIFDSLSNSMESNRVATSWAAKNLASVVTQPPRVEYGKVIVRKGTSRTAL